MTSKQLNALSAILGIASIGWLVVLGVMGGTGFFGDPDKPADPLWLLLWIGGGLAGILAAAHFGRRAKANAATEPSRQEQIIQSQPKPVAMWKVRLLALGGVVAIPVAAYFLWDVSAGSKSSDIYRLGLVFGGGVPFLTCLKILFSSSSKKWKEGFDRTVSPKISGRAIGSALGNIARRVRRR